VPTSKLAGAWNASTAAVIASFGPWTGDRVINRALARGPSGSTLRFYIGDDVPVQLVGSNPDEVDYSLVGSEDYGSWLPPLPVPAGWYAVFAWTGGSTGASSTGTVRLEWEDNT
jgi:hypothetical protein